MPAGMLLRSPWDASHLADPNSEFTLDAYQSTCGTTLSRPVPLTRFVDYGRWFQRHAVPHAEARQVLRIEPDAAGFRIELDNETCKARRVVVAAGIVPFAARPQVFDGVPRELASHSCHQRDFAQFSGKRVAVIGAGQSGLESAALLQEAGAEVEVLARQPQIRWLARSASLHRSFVSKLLYAPSDVGPAGVSQLVARPNLFKLLPRRLQDKLGVRSIRPAGSAWVKPRVEGVVLNPGRSVISAVPVGDHVTLTLDDGTSRSVNHVLLATGFRVDVTKYPFLSEALLTSIRRVHGLPCLGAGLETSVPGLHFVGAPAAWSFGPLMRFVAGAPFAARALASRIGRTVVQRAPARHVGHVFESAQGEI